MLERHESQDGQTDAGHDVKHRDAAGDSISTRPVTDREVPLGGLAASEDESMTAIHQWLDGDTSEADVMRTDAKHVALWNQIADETARRRRMVTPSYVAANIMNALPDVAVKANVQSTLQTHVQKNVQASTATDTMVAPTAARAGVSLTTVMMIGAVLFATGMLIGKML